MTLSALTRGGAKAIHTRDSIIEALQRYAALYGDDFTAAAFSPSTAKWRDRGDELIDRYYLGDPDTGKPWPSLNTIKSRFDDSFNAARVAAGFEPNTPGPGTGRRPAGAHKPVRDVSHVGATRYVERDSGALDRARKRIAHLEQQLAEARAKTPKTKTVVDREALQEARARARDARTDAARLAAKLERAEATINTLRADRKQLRADVARAERVAAAAGTQVDVVEVPVDRVVEKVITRTRPAPEEAVLAAAQAEKRAAVAAQRTALKRAEDAEARYAELAQAVTGSERHLTPSELKDLVKRGPAGPAVLADALKKLAKVRATGNTGAEMRTALTRVAQAAVSWRERL